MLSGTTPTNPLKADQLLERFATGTGRQRRTLVKTIETRLDDLIDLGPDLLKPFDPTASDPSIQPAGSGTKLKLNSKFF